MERLDDLIYKSIGYYESELINFNSKDYESAPAYTFNDVTDFIVSNDKKVVEFEHSNDSKVIYTLDMAEGDALVEFFKSEEGESSYNFSGY